MDGKEGNAATEGNVGFSKPDGHLVPVGTPELVCVPERKEQGAMVGFTQLPGDFLKFWPPAKFFGFWFGLITMTVIFCIELSEDYPKANDMLAIAALVAIWWAFEVMHLSATSLLPMILIPLCSISRSATIAASYWGWVQMLFLGAFIVDAAIMHVNLHKRIALKCLLLIGNTPLLVLFVFMSVAYFLSMWCSNTSTTVMLVPFATGLLDSAFLAASEKQDADDLSATQALEGVMKRYNVGVLLGIAYAATCGGVATTIGTPPNGVLIQQDVIAGEISTSEWFAFAIPMSATLVVCAFVLLALVYIRGVTVKVDKSVLHAKYAELGPINRDEIVVAFIQFLQIFGYLIRVDVINDESITSPADLTGVNDSTIACTAAILLFIIPSVKNPGKAVISWPEAEQKIEWGVILLMGAGGAISKGFSESSLTAYLGEELGDLSDFSSLGLIFLIVFSICGFTEMASNTATANTVLPILSTVARSTLTHPMRMLIPATCACSFAFMLPVATPPNAIVFGTNRIQIADFLKAGLVMNIVAVVLGSLIIYGMGNAVFEFEDPFPEYACFDSCTWIDIAGEVDGTSVTSQACVILSDMTCRLKNGTVVNTTV